MPIQIDNNSSTPIYQQLIHSIQQLIDTGEYKAGDLLPSMNQLSAEFNISRETAKKAYNILRDKGYLEPIQGKGFYAKRPGGQKSRILMLFDKLSTYKLVLYRSFTENIGNDTDITIHLHNQDVELFRKLIEENLGHYDYYVITPNFPLDDENQSHIRSLLKKIPNRKLILLDHYISGLTGNIGAVYQSFEKDVYTGLEQGISLLRKYRKINAVYAKPGSLYSRYLIKGINRFCNDNGFEFDSDNVVDSDKIKKGEVYIVLNGQHDTELFEIIRSTRAKGFKLGEEIGLVSYNESPINEFILDGLTTLSTDFALMGKVAAEMIKTGELNKIHNQFNLIIRKTL